MDLKQLLGLAAQMSLMLTVFSFGLRATRHDALYLIHRPGLLLRTLLAMFVVTPVAVVILVRIFNTPRLVEVAMVALAIAPVPPLLPRKLTKAAGTSGYGIGLLVTAGVAALVIVPLWVWLLGQFTGRPLTMPNGGIAGTVTSVIIVPLTVGMLARYFVPGVALGLAGPAAKIGGALLALVAALLLVVAAPTMLALIRDGALGIMTAFVVIGLAVGHVLGSPGAEHQSVLAIATASRHPGIGLALASANFPGERFGAVILLYLVVAAIVCIPYIKWHQSARLGSARSPQFASRV